MVVLNGNFAVGCGPGTDYPYIHIFQCMLERTDVITNEVLEPITIVLAYPTVLSKSTFCIGLYNRVIQARVVSFPLIPYVLNVQLGL
jgi:hypothetical protein